MLSVVFFLQGVYIVEWQNVRLTEKLYQTLLDFNLFIYYIYILNESTDFHPDANEQEISVFISGTNLSEKN